MIIREGDANIKYLFIVIIVAVFVGGGIFLLKELLNCSFWWPSQQVFTTEDETADWIGAYKYSEFAQDVYGSDQTWIYELEIYEEKERLEAKLNIDGFQTLTRIQAVAEEQNGNLNIIFDSYRPENMYESYQKGDLLFSLEKISEEECRILWGKMKSNLLEPGDAKFKKVPKDETADWQTYRNEKIGIEFQYPEEVFGTVYVIREEETIVAIIFVKEKDNPKENTILYFDAFASNYEIIPPGFGVFTGDKDILSYCPESLKIIRTRNGDWKVCKIIEIADQKAIFETFASGYEGSDSFAIYVYFNNRDKSTYKGLMFTLMELDVNKEIIRFMEGSLGEENEEKFESYFYTQSINIMENKNLSEKDKEKLKAFDQILSTFKFIEQASSSAAVFCTVSLACPVKMKCENKKCVDVGCVAEGQDLPGTDYELEYLSHLPSECCQGLNKVSYSGYFDENCNYIPLEAAPSGTCTKCGNGICETWETKCNCPKDCQGSETYRSEKYGFEFKYPKDLIDLRQEPFESYLKRSDPNFTVIKTLQMKTPDPAKYANSVLIEGAIQFTVATSSDIVSSCLEPEASWGEYNISSETINGIEFARYDHDDAGLGHRLSERVFSTILNNICYRVEIVISGSWFDIGPELTREKAEEDEVKYELPFSVYDAIDKLTPILSTFRFIEKIKTGKVKIDYESIAAIQKSVDEGHQPWQLNPVMVAASYAYYYGFTEDDIKTLSIPDVATQEKFGTEITEVNLEITHIGKVYIMTLIQPITGSGKIWTIWEIELKE